MSNYIKSFQILKALIPIYSIYQYINEISILISQSWLQFSLFFIKNHINYQYKLLSCISGVDLVDKEYRFCVVYDLISFIFNTRIRVKSLISCSMISFSIVNIYKNANWWEREIWDMFGIFFYGHFDLRRILTDYGFEGHPMKKDFPLFGFVELRYNETKKKVVVEAVVLAQEYRTFNFETPWSI